MPTLYVATEDAVLVARGSPGDWRTRESLIEYRPETVAVHPDDPDTVLVGTFESGLQRSQDRGEAFERVGADAIESDAVTHVAVDPTDPARWWAGTEPSAVYRSSDAGETWTPRPGLTDLPSASGWSFPPRPHTHHVRWIEVDPADPEHLFVGVEAGALVQTRDAGASWTDRVPDSRRDNHSLTTHPDAPGRAWAAAGDGYAETHDAGETWVHPQEGLAHRYVWSVALDPADPDTVLVSSASGASKAHGHGGAASAESYLYRRVGERDWERLDDRGIPTGEGVLRAVLARGDDPGELYAANNHGCFRTTDAGDSWASLDVAWPERLRQQTVRGLAVVP